ncbi:MAG: magnesium transporter [Erysipelotrichaceae bacterium]|nr:magnesium transporter [Erysipelotrichaceae bacterium]MDD4641925.1 magnesium transporter [Erysipelotrichaceae bacterium]
MEKFEMITTELLKDLIDKRQLKDLRDIYNEYNIVDMALATEELEISSILFVFRILPKEISGQLFSYFSSDNKQALIDAFTNEEIQTVLINMYADDMADFISDMPANLVKKILMSANKQQRNQINSLLSFPEYSAGSIMNIDYVELKQDDTLEKALKKIRNIGKKAETISVCYVSDESKHLVGAIKPEDILFENSNDLIKDHMDEHIVSCNTFDDQEDVAKLFARYDLDVLPVVNNDQCLIGIITIDDIVDVMEEEITEDIQKMAAIRPVDGSYLETSVFKMAKSRLPWLLILMLSATFTGMVLHAFESKLMIIPALVAFVPMIMGSSGNAGNQSAVMVIRSMAISEIEKKDLFKVIYKESKIALVCGILLFLVALLRIWLFPPQVELIVALIICLTMLISVLIGNLLGATLPFLSLVLKQDPAATTTPILTTIIDIVSLLIYFSLCTLILGI